MLLIDIVEYARRLKDRLKSCTRAQYDADFMLRHGVAHILQIIGEAAAKVSAETRARYATIPCKQVVGMRNRLVHEYWRIDDELVWETATQSIPDLLRTLEPEIGPIIDAHESGQDKK